MGESKTIERSLIQEDPKALRGVNIETQAFKDLVSSIRTKGIVNPIAVRPAGDGATYIVLDGLQRYTASGILNMEKVPVHILDIDEDDVVETQIEANLHRIETKPIEYTRALQRIMMKHPERSIEEQAKRLSKSAGWLRDRLSLSSFEGEAAALIEDGKIALSNAYALAKINKLAPAETDEWLERAQTMPPEQFIPDALKREAELKAAQKSGTKPAAATGPAVKLRKLGDIKAEYQRAQGLAATKPTDYNRGYLDFAAWALTQDAVSLEAWKKAEEERQRQKEERAKEREAEKAKKAAENQSLSIADLVKLPEDKKAE